TRGEADQLRRAMGAWRRPGVIEQFRKKLIDGMLARGLSPQFAEQVFHQIRGFGEYGFPESHAASFALLVYVSSWLKCYYPAAFDAAIINSQPMGFYAPAQLIADAKKHGVKILPIDVNASEWDCTLETAGNENAIRLGFRLVSGLAEKPAEVIVKNGKEQGFGSFADFVHRTGLRSGALKKLGQADAFRSLELGRRAALWKSLPEREPPTLFDAFDQQEPPNTLPPMTPFEEVLADYGASGLTLRQHPVSFLRDMLSQLNVMSSDQLQAMKSGVKLKVGGIVLMRQRP